MMQAVPSLVGTGTAVAAAASGLVFAQSTDEQPRRRPASALPNWSSAFDNPSSPSCPIPTSRPHAKSVSYAMSTEYTGYSYSYNSQDSSSAGQHPTPAPSTGATLPQLAVATPIPTPKGVGRRRSLIHRGDAHAVSDASRDSVSSNGSWIRRLSLRPLSHVESSRSSIGPDSHSMNFSLGSSAPIVSPGPATSAQQQPRNKLVKRTKAVRDGSSDSLKRRGSRSQLLTLRRPATSNQRSATLQHSPLAADSSSFVPSTPSYPKCSFERLSCTPELDDEVTRGRKDTMPTRLLSFFHERVAKSSASSRGNSPFPRERSSSVSSFQRNPLPTRTIQVQGGQSSPAILTKPSTLRPLRLGSKHSRTLSSLSYARGTGEEHEESYSQFTRARRSLSIHLSSPIGWISRASSLRRSKRGSEYSASSNASSSIPNLSSPPTSGNKRHVSAPSPTTQLPSPLHTHMQPRSVTAPTDLRLHRVMDESGFAQSNRASHRDQDMVVRRSSPIPPYSSDSSRLVPGRQRNSSSPLPIILDLSNFNDLSRLGLAISTSEAVVLSAKEGGRQRSQSAAAFAGCAYPAIPRAFPLVPHSREVSYERSFTVAGSESEMRGFGSSGDDDDTDFKSETLFDSVRTAASARIRITDTPIESMFDESPPGTASNTKSKRLSIQEILGQSWDSDTRILEEDEGASTPMNAAVRKSLTPTLPGDQVHSFGALNSGANAILASSATAYRVDPSLAFAHEMSFARLSLDDDDADDDDNEGWARIDDSGVTNNLSPPSSQSNSLRGLHGLHAAGIDISGSHRAYPGQRPALAFMSGNGTSEAGTHCGSSVHEIERVRSNLFDWSESTAQTDKAHADGHSPRPKTVHGKQEMDLRGGRPSNRKGPGAGHVRSQSVPALADFIDGAKPTTSKFGTWASSGPKNPSEDWDDDFDFEANGDDDAFVAFGSSQLGEAAGSIKGPSTPFAMIVPASIQATQPTVKAHSGQIRELSLLVDGLKRLCRHARDLEIVNESPALWKEAENIIALASPDEEVEGTAPTSSVETDDTGTHSDGDWSRRTSAEFGLSSTDARFVDDGFDAGTLNSFDDVLSSPRLSHQSATSPPHEMSRTAVVRERQGLRRRSVFSPEDDIFGGGWPLRDETAVGVTEQQNVEEQEQERPRTPERPMAASETPDSAMIESIMEAMQQQRSTSAPIRKSPVKTKSTELFFNTNTLQELVKRANTLYHSLSDLVRRAELLTQSPSCTPKHDRPYRRDDGSPAFTRVFTDPSTPSRRLPNSQSAGSLLSRASPSVESPASTGISRRLQLMTVN
ncbi:hypothetical protein CMQ_6176 [Grosmannia clavigera kw1407]|uniref:Uncharacterized protein n=1 Tax=Grosmannia clavigera (strain kw1407 / UAMH 11150) TaxID=655863 RepID=F0XMK4_GROCL|nr:uncharacterized protein CMQ_6176 [Grosmannia clavigera kw1407]EFX01234.1 hypothetical protein CMQ_6176 [Grosmannia clavigera kw1407]